MLQGIVDFYLVIGCVMDSAPMASGISIRDTWRGVWPFVASDVARVAILVAFPIITLGVLKL